MTHGFNSGLSGAHSNSNRSNETRWCLEFTIPCSTWSMCLSWARTTTEAFGANRRLAPFVRRQVQVLNSSYLWVSGRCHRTRVFPRPVVCIYTVILHNAVSFMETLEQHQTRNGLYFGSLTILALITCYSSHIFVGGSMLCSAG